jgi:pilus assembly protein Flp/PilA
MLMNPDQVSVGAAQPDRAALGPARWKAIWTVAGLPWSIIHMLQLIDRLHQNEEGAALVEYGLLVSLIAVLCLGGVTLIGQEISTAFSTYAAALAVI